MTSRIGPCLRFGALLALPMLTSCEGAGGLKVLENPPGVVITEPQDGDEFDVGDTITFVGRVDSSFTGGDIQIIWASDIDGTFEDLDPPDPEGWVEFVTASLSEGTHVMTLRAIDANAEQGEDYITVVVGGEPPDPEAPTISITHPTSVEQGLENTEFLFGATVSDLQDAPEDIYAEVSESSSGFLCEMIVDVGGNASCGVAMPIGNYTLTFLARDTDGNEVTASTPYQVIDPDDRDVDGDGFSINGGDCDDGNPTVYPGAEELCDELDNNCNEVIDEGAANIYYLDEDGDGWGVNTGYVEDCTQPFGYAEDLGDCDDSNALINPDAIEICDDEVDNNCNGLLNEQNASGCTAHYEDGDGDGYGAGASQCWCTGGSSPYTSTRNDDCYDTNPAVHPDQTNYYTYDRGDRSFDYNCNGASEQQYSSVANSCAWDVVYIDCDLSGSQGFDGGVPACGDTEQWINDCSATYDPVCYALCLFSSDPIDCLLNTCGATCDADYTSLTQGCR